MSHEVFISHSDKDRPTAEAVCDALESAGVRCWLASRDIVGGNYGEAIMKAIKASRIMVVVLTPDANASRHVLREVERAVANGVTLYPFKVKKTELSDALEYFISSEQSLDATQPPLEKHLARLSRNVARMLGRADERPAQPPPPAQPTPVVKEPAPASAPAPRADFKYDAFISYSSPDRRWAEALHRDVEARGFKCFFDNQLLQAGDGWRAEVKDSLMKSRHFIVLWSNYARDSDWVRRELAMFEAMIDPQGSGLAGEDRKIIFVVLEGELLTWQAVQRIDDVKDARVYSRGFEPKDRGVWGKVIRKVAGALSQ